MFIRTAHAGDPASFGAGTGPDLPDLTEQTSRMWAAGRSRPQWCFVALDGEGSDEPSGDRGSDRGGGVSASGHGRVSARIGLSVVHDPAAAIDSRHPDVELLRCAFGAVPLELGVFGLAYPGGAGAAIELLREVLGKLDVGPGSVIEPRSNAETHPDTATRHEIFTGCGFALFQEKHGYAWSAADGTPPQPEGLRLAPVDQVGLPSFLDVMARAGAATLDRNDRHYYALCGPQGWARVMIEYMLPEDTPTWCAGVDGDGNIIGFVAVSAFDEPATATIVHIGVLPQHRGHGHG